jgi:hypothetical protein
MSEQNTDLPAIIAASPIIREPGLLPYQIVIGDLGYHYVVHTEVLERGRKPWYHHGDYFRKDNKTPSAHESDAEAPRKPWSRFEERARRSLNMERPPAQRLAEVSDVAESIINALLPEDSDDRRDIIGADYQLESDIETFEQFTGKAIQPHDELPVVGDEIEMADVERSV